MTRLYCPDLNVFVDPTDHNILVWYQQHRADPTIGVLQTYMLYEVTHKIRGVKYWDEKTHKIRYSKPRKTKESKRYRLYEIPWSGLHDKNKRPIFHGDVLDVSDGRGPLVCQVDAFGVKLETRTGLIWDIDQNLSIEELRITGSAILDPQLVAEEIRNLFTYPHPEP